MKLLLDENLSRRLVPFLQDRFPGTTQVALAGLERASDRELWAYAREHDLVIVTQDADFQELSLLQGHPPKVVWLKLRSPSRGMVLNCLLDHSKEIELALADESIGCIEIGR